MENTYIVTTTPRDEETQGLEALTYESLYEAGFSFNQPFYLGLSDHQCLLCDEVVRILPHKRMVVFGRWQGKPIVAKLFFDPVSAKRHYDSDVNGVKLLQANKIPTPELFYEGHTPDKKVYVLIFQKIEESTNLEDLFRGGQSYQSLLPILEAIIVEVATQHVLGLLQKDLHLHNFLLTQQTIYTLDGAQIEAHKGLVPKQASMANLALLLSQLGVNVRELQQHLFTHYANSRGWALKPDDYAEMHKLIQRANEERWQAYEKKIFRNSSHFAKYTTSRSLAMVNRYFQDDELNVVIQEPELAFQHKTASMLKAGGSSTVIKVCLDHRWYVVKRYNLKSKWHRMRRLFRTTRAACAWRLAQKCYLFNVPTAMPVAFVEKRFLGMRGTSYYISQYISSEHAGEYFFKHFTHSEKISEMVSKLTELFKSVAHIDMTHGDLKITNILIDHNEQPVLIDFDGAREHRSESRLKLAWNKEIKRFLNNFSNNPNVLKQFEMEFQQWL